MHKDEELDAFLIRYWEAENVWESNKRKPLGKKSGRLGIRDFLLQFGQEDEEYEEEMERAMTKRPAGWNKRMFLSMFALAVLVPVTIYAGIHYMDNRKYLFISMMLLIYAILPFIILFEGRKPKARELVVIAVLSAITVAGRGAFFMLPSFKPVAAMVILSGVAFGPEAGFLVACMSMLLSNFMFGQGPWTPWQMAAYGFIGFLSGILFKKGRLKRKRSLLCLYGFFSVIFIFGGIMNPATLVMYSYEVTWQGVLAMYVSGLPFDLIQAFSTVVFLWIGARPMLRKMERVKKKYGLLN